MLVNGASPDSVKNEMYESLVYLRLRSNIFNNILPTLINEVNELTAKTADLGPSLTHTHSFFLSLSRNVAAHPLSNASYLNFFKMKLEYRGYF